MARKKKAETVAPKATPQAMPDIATMGGFRIPQRIMIVGCGGTGAYVSGHLARLISVLSEDPDRPYGGIKLILVDGDKVEQKNLERQHFIRQDLGLNKAEALAARYSAAFGMEIEVVPSYLEDANAVATLDPQLLIGCVDNNASRKIMNTWFVHERDYAYSGRFWIDSGNEENSGQVVCGFMPPSGGNPYRYGGDLRPNEELFSLPTVAEVYPALLEKDGKFNSQLSCAELAASAPQNMMTNITAAAIVLNFAQKILRGKPLRAHGAVFSVDNSFRTMLNTPENLAKVDHGRRRPWERTNRTDAQTI